MYDIKLDNAKEEQSLTYIVLYESIARLEPRERAILGLVYVGYSRAEAARLLGISGNWTGVLYRRTLQKLAEDCQNA